LPKAKGDTKSDPRLHALKDLGIVGVQTDVFSYRPPPPMPHLSVIALDPTYPGEGPKFESHDDPTLVRERIRLQEELEPWLEGVVRFAEKVPKRPKSLKSDSSDTFLIGTYATYLRHWVTDSGAMAVAMAIHLGFALQREISRYADDEVRRGHAVAEGSKKGGRMVRRTVEQLRLIWEASKKEKAANTESSERRIHATVGKTLGISRSNVYRACKDYEAMLSK